MSGRAETHQRKSEVADLSIQLFVAGEHMTCTQVGRELVLILCFFSICQSLVQAVVFIVI